MAVIALAASAQESSGEQQPSKCGAWLRDNTPTQGTASNSKGTLDRVVLQSARGIVNIHRRIRRPTGHEAGDAENISPCPVRIPECTSEIDSCILDHLEDYPTLHRERSVNIYSIVIGAACTAGSSYVGSYIPLEDRACVVCSRSINRL